MPGIDLAHNMELRKANELWDYIYPLVKDKKIDEFELGELFEKNKEIVFKWFPYILCNCDWSDEVALKIKKLWCRDYWFENYDKFIY